MGSRSSILLRDEEIDEIRKETGFSHNQIIRLYHRFNRLDKGNNGFLSREDFLRIPELAINPLGDRIIHAFFGISRDQTLNFKQFVKVLATFRPVQDGSDNRLNSREEKLKFAFKMYDVDGNDKISRDELLLVLQMMVGANISEEQLGCIADRTIQEADGDNDGLISFEEFCGAMDRTDVEQKMSIRFLH
ncbi:calcineurin B homologous protein 1-like [Ptychodera flava]|uniref:calcineurin B homologous protein 1-like n=1 Tax=Ptychodera flava TaxID=63121 RepID=UPI00396A87C9